MIFMIPTYCGLFQVTQRFQAVDHKQPIISISNSRFVIWDGIEPTKRDKINPFGPNDFWLNQIWSQMVDAIFNNDLFQIDYLVDLLDVKLLFIA